MRETMAWTRAAFSAFSLSVPACVCRTDLIGDVTTQAGEIVDQRTGLVVDEARQFGRAAGKHRVELAVRSSEDGADRIAAGFERLFDGADAELDGLGLFGHPRFGFGQATGQFLGVPATLAVNSGRVRASASAARVASLSIVGRHRQRPPRSVEASVVALPSMVRLTLSSPMVSALSMVEKRSFDMVDTAVERLADAGGGVNRTGLDADELVFELATEAAAGFLDALRQAVDVVSRRVSRLVRLVSICWPVSVKRSGHSGHGLDHALAKTSAVAADLAGGVAELTAMSETDWRIVRSRLPAVSSMVAFSCASRFSSVMSTIMVEETRLVALAWMRSSMASTAVSRAGADGFLLRGDAGVKSFRALVDAASARSDLLGEVVCSGGKAVIEPRRALVDGKPQAGFLGADDFGEPAGGFRRSGRHRLRWPGGDGLLGAERSRQRCRRSR